jgi:hypothetical protein
MGYERIAGFGKNPVTLRLNRKHPANAGRPCKFRVKAGRAGGFRAAAIGDGMSR